MKSDKKSKVVLIGLDGAPYPLVRDWAAEGVLPSLNAMIQEGAFSVLESTTHPISPIAWTTLVTGMNPGKHGIFDFGIRQEGTYEQAMVNAFSRKTPALWDWIGQWQGRCGIFNVPVTYPASQINGYMVTGLLTPSRESEFTFPAELKSFILETAPDYRVPGEDAHFVPGREMEFIWELMKSVEVQEKAVLAMIDRYPDLDFHMFVFMQTDHLHHKMWQYIEDPQKNPSYFSAIQKLYGRIDQAVGRIRSKFDENTVFMVVSDHGGGSLTKIVSLNRWLIQKGFLVLKQSPARIFKKWLKNSRLIPFIYGIIRRLGLASLAKKLPPALQHRLATSFSSFEDVDWKKTRAYACGKYGQIFVNLQGREPEGSVAPGEEYERTLREIEKELLAWQDPFSGGPVIKNVFRSRDLYQGDYFAEAADLIFCMKEYQYDSSVDLGFLDDEIFREPEFDDTGTHRLEGILIACGKNIRKKTQIPQAHPSLMDIAPTVLALLGQEIPEEMDGHVLDFMLQGIDSQKRFKADLEPEFAVQQTRELSEKEKEDIENRLKNLGYLG